MMQPWLYQVALVASNEVLWLGPIVKIKRSASDSIVEIQAETWEAWLGRIWLPSEYDADGFDVDVATVVEQRLEQARQFVATEYTGLQPPLPPAAGVPLVGLLVEYEFASPWTLGPPEDWAGQPSSVWDELSTYADRGVSVRLRYEMRDDGLFVPSLGGAAAGLCRSSDRS